MRGEWKSENVEKLPQHHTYLIQLISNYTHKTAVNTNYGTYISNYGCSLLFFPTIILILNTIPKTITVFSLIEAPLQ